MSDIPSQIRLNSIARPALDSDSAAIVRAEETAKLAQEQAKLISDLKLGPDNITYVAIWDEEKYERLLLLIARGLSVKKAAAMVGIEPSSQVYYWVVRNEAFGRAYLQACQSKCMMWAEELVDLADECPADIPSVAKCRQQIDVRKWMLSKIVPKVFGEKLQVNHDVKGSPQVNIILPGKGGRHPGLPPAPPDAAATITTNASVIEMENQNELPLPTDPEALENLYRKIPQDNP